MAQGLTGTAVARPLLCRTHPSRPPPPHPPPPPLLCCALQVQRRQQKQQQKDTVGALPAWDPTRISSFVGVRQAVAGSGCGCGQARRRRRQALPLANANLSNGAANGGAVTTPLPLPIVSDLAAAGTAASAHDAAPLLKQLWPPLLPACSGAYNLYALADHLHRRGLYRNLFEAIHSLDGRPLLRELSPTFLLRCGLGAKTAEHPGQQDERKGCFKNAAAERALHPEGCSLLGGCRRGPAMRSAVPTTSATLGCLMLRRKLGPSVGRSLPPVLILHGTADKSVPMEIAVEFVAALKVRARPG